METPSSLTGTVCKIAAVCVETFEPPSKVSGKFHWETLRNKIEIQFSFSMFNYSSIPQNKEQTLQK